MACCLAQSLVAGESWLESNGQYSAWSWLVLAVQARAVGAIEKLGAVVGFSNEEGEGLRRLQTGVGDDDFLDLSTREADRQFGIGIHSVACDDLPPSPTGMQHPASDG